MKPGVLIITGETAKYGSGHDVRMRAVALELKKRKIDVQKVTLAPDEHVAYEWLPWREAEARCFSWTNRDAIRRLPQLAARQGR